MKLKQKGFIHIASLVLVFFIAILIAVIGYYVFNNSKKSQYSTTQTKPDSKSATTVDDMGLPVEAKTTTDSQPVISNSQTNNSSPKANSPPQATSQPSTTNAPADKTIAVEMYIDYQSPSSAGFYNILKQVKVNYSSNKNVTFTYKHYPLESIHANARYASKAVESAKALGKYHEMQDKIMINQATWSVSPNPTQMFESYATQIGLNLSDYKQKFNDSRINDIIDSDINSGKVAGLIGVPTFYFSGTQIDNNELTTVEKFSTQINQRL